MNCISHPPTPRTIGRPYTSHISQSHRERDDDYQGVVCYLSERWRIVICRDNRQWIVQKRSTLPSNRGVRIGKSYLTSRTALINVCSRLALLSDRNAEATLLSQPAYAHQIGQK